MALLGLCLLPTEYHAGDDTAHAHSLLQLWADASDGVVHHHDAGAATSHHHEAHAHGPGEPQPEPDLADQQDSAPTASGVLMLLTAILTPPALARSSAAICYAGERLRGHQPRVLLPPPRRRR
jgi:hypothetical protein